MTREEAHALVDQLFDMAGTDTNTNPLAAGVEESVPDTPKNKRVVRTRTSGDTVYYLDEEKKTRQRIIGSTAAPGPEIVESLGFNMANVEEVDDLELSKYDMGPAIYQKAGDGQQA